MANRVATRANETQLISTWKTAQGNLKTLTKGRVMRLNRAAAGIATVAIASAAIVSGCGVTHQGAVPVTRPAPGQRAPGQHAPGPVDGRPASRLYRPVTGLAGVSWRPGAGDLQQ